MLHIHACNDACMEYGYLSFFQQKNPFKFQNKSNYDMNDAEQKTVLIIMPHNPGFNVRYMNLIISAQYYQ